jgi:hypothetical protein
MVRMCAVWEMCVLMCLGSRLEEREGREEGGREGCCWIVARWM